LEIPLPEIDEQEKIVDVLESVDSVAKANKEHLDSFLRVKQGLMQDLLSGEVRTHSEGIDILDDVLQYG
jgi:type I restriction enzyme S subunit